MIILKMLNLNYDNGFVVEAFSKRYSFQVF